MIIPGLNLSLTSSPSSSPYQRLLEMIPLPLARLMHIMDYLIHYFYDPPPALMDQVQWNLFTSHTHLALDDKSDNLNKTHFACREVEENFLRNLSSQEAKGKPDI